MAMFGIYVRFLGCTSWSIKGDASSLPLLKQISHLGLGVLHGDEASTFFVNCIHQDFFFNTSFGNRKLEGSLVEIGNLNHETAVGNLCFQAECVDSSFVATKTPKTTWLQLF